MPKITQYLSGVPADGLPQNQQARASDFANNGLTNLAQAGGQAAQIYRQQKEVDDVSNVRVEMAKARAEWETHFKNRAAQSDAGDPAFASDFKQELAKYFEDTRQIAQTGKGQQTFDLLAAELGGHFSEKADVYQAQSAGVKARQDWDTSLNQYGSAIISDPTTYGAVSAQMMAEINDPNGKFSDQRLGMSGKKIRGELIANAKDQLARSYINGLVDNGAPELARRILIDGKLDDVLTADNKQQMIRFADQGINAKEVAANHAVAMAQKAEKERVAKVNDDLMGQFISGKLNVSAVRGAGLPAFGEGSQNTWISMLKAQTKEATERPNKTDPNVLRDLFDRINLSNDDPRKITDLKPITEAYIKNKLSTTDMERASKWVQDARTDSGQRLGQAQSQFLAGMKGRLDKSTMNRLDDGGSERFYNFQVYVNDKVAKAREAKEDPYELFNPSSKKYLGNDVGQFQTSAQKLQRDIAGQINESLDTKKARLPNETPEEYLNRMKK